jgi:outer membrane receptor protein involved in Fe transport
MPTMPPVAKLARALSLALLAGAAGAAAAQSVPPLPDGGESASRKLDTIVVQSEIAYRDRSDAIAPTLSYDLEYFQRFEPLTVGDMLKRVPSVAFVSDVLEYDGARLRGLDPGYTQILINGKKVPGAGTDRSFFVDRIPAELVERIEIIRNTSANRSGDAVAGALNIVLRDAYEFDGKYLRVGALHFDDGEFKPTYGGVASGQVGEGRLLAGFNVQGRYNPKEKRSDRFEQPGGDFVDREDQDDTRDGTDYSANLSYTQQFDDSRLSLRGLAVLTERDETEHSLEYNDPASVSRDHLLSENNQFEDIEQHNYTLGGSYEFGAFGGRNEIDIDYAAFDEDTVGTEEEASFDDEDTPPSFDGLEGQRTLTDIEDEELSLKLAHEREVSDTVTMEFGIDAIDKQRDTQLQVSEVEADDEGDPLPPYGDFDLQSSHIEESRLDPYLMFTGGTGTLEWETGLRYETTDSDIEADGETASSDYSILLPSAHLRWNLTDDDRLLLSLGRSVRRPNFNFLLPLTLEEEYGDNDFAGNPLLEPETAWGVDLGFERRLGRQGIVGVNLFYRDVKDLIEIVNTGAPSATALDDYEEEVEEFLDENPDATPDSPDYPEFDPDSFVYTAANVGDGSVYGIEFDASTPLTAWGLPDTGVFVNYSWLDSSVDDEFGERTFNDQADYVYNVGFIQDLPDWAASFGASYRRQGTAFSRLLAQEVTTRYGADLEIFIEKRFGDRMSLRLTGSNLLNASKDELFNKFDNAQDQLDRDFDEYEVETEESGPVYQVIARVAF